jgi:GPI mannosyltransferase 3
VTIETWRPAAEFSGTLDRGWLQRAGLTFVVIAAIGLRLIPVVFVPTMVWGDEIFQSSEQAHRLVFGTGLLPWEFQVGIRSWLLPGAIAGLMELSRLAGDGPEYYLPVIALAFAVLAAIPVICCFWWGRRLTGALGGWVAAAVVAVAPELVYFGARTLSEVVAGHLLVATLYTLEPGYRVTSRRRLFTGGALLGLVFILRIQLAPALLVVAVWATWRSIRQCALPMFAGAAAALAAAGILDTLTLGAPLISVWRYLLYNVYYGASEEFGVEPWHFYLLGEFGLWGGAAATLLPLVAFGARRMPLPLATALTIVAVHSGIGHKEYRFVYPAVLLLMVLAGIGLAQISSSGQGWLQDRGVRKSIAIVGALAISLGWWCLVSLQVWTGPVLSELRDRARDNLAAMSFVAHDPVICGLGLYGLDGKDWVDYGGYTYLHRSAPMYWPKDEPELNAFARAFDTLIYTRPPAGEAGFTLQHCFGTVCVAHRSGGCAALPMMAMPFPQSVPRPAAAPSPVAASAR